MKASYKFKKGKWTTCNTTAHNDGSSTITIFDAKSNGKKSISFTVKNLNKQNEEILSDEDE